MLRTHWLFFLLLLGLSAFYIVGVDNVPFHPDESTFIFMSAEFDRILTDPLSMTWRVGDPISDITRYRMIDAPLTRYLLGFGRLLTGQHALEMDWDWSATWRANQISGALPTERLLLIERLTVASLFPLSLLLLYLIGLRLSGRVMGISAVLLFSLNPLILLHTRRAMSEGVLILGVLLTLYIFINANKRPLLVGLAVAIAFNAKHSAIILLPIGLLAVCWQPDLSVPKFSRLSSNLSQYLAGFFILTALLNPFLWREPLSAAAEALAQRQNLLDKQVADIQQVSPAQILKTPTERAAVSLAQLFIAPPLFSEVANYRPQTVQMENEYLDTPGNYLFRQQIIGGFILGFTLLGLLVMIRTSFSGLPAQRRIMGLYLLSFLSLGSAIVLIVPLAWQRYSVPLIPFVVIFASLGLVWGIKNSRRFIFRGSWSSRLSQVLAQFAPDSRVS